MIGLFEPRNRAIHLAGIRVQLAQRKVALHQIERLGLRQVRVVRRKITLQGLARLDQRLPARGADPAQILFATRPLRQRRKRRRRFAEPGHVEHVLHIAPRGQRGIHAGGTAGL